jgi:GNAT superfamily N-acetyltransferase
MNIHLPLARLSIVPFSEPKIPKEPYFAAHHCIKPRILTTFCLQKPDGNQNIGQAARILVRLTNDDSLKKQYYTICEQEFKDVHHLSEYNIIPDDRFLVFVILYDGKCVGGLSVAIKRPGSSRLLPEEGVDFRFADCVPELDQSNMSYGLFSRFALLPEFRGGKITRTIFSVLYDYVRALDLDLVLAIGPLANARLYKQIYSSMGFKNGKIHFDIDVPHMPGYAEQEYLVSARITGSPAKEVNAG